jgi:endonuclease/exonuclease/phosphatase family metal-dependent hydrolase
MFEKLHPIVTAVLVASLAAACHGDLGRQEDALHVAAPPLRLLTFNAGLARGYLGLVDERREAMGRALAQTPADVVCLQEVWDPADVAALIAATADAYPYAHWADTTEDESGGAAACEEAELGPLGVCMFTRCASATDVAACAVDQCRPELAATSPRCQQCLVANLEKPLAEILATCAQGSGERLYGGANGVLLLSRLPLRDAGHDVLDSFLIRNVALHAEVAAAGAPLRVMCTHLASRLPGIQYDGAHGSYEGENRAQVLELLAIIEGGDPAVPVALLGDLNTGPAAPGITADWPAHYELFLQAGLRAPYLEVPAPRCTWCASNRHVDDGGAEKIIDHVLLLGLDRAIAVARRALDTPFALADGAGVTDLSDHFGAMVTITPAGR